MDLVKLNTCLGKKIYLGVLGALLIGFNMPAADSPTLRLALIALFAYMTFVTALETSLLQFGKALIRPWISLWILALVHLGTPLLAWLLGYLFYPNDINIRTGYLVAASVPVGVTSVIWTSLAGGNVAVSLVTLALDTILVPAFLPAFFLVTIGHAIHIDYLEMASQLMWMITIPSLAGMALHDLFKDKAVVFAKGFGGVTAKATFFVVIFLNAALAAPSVNWNAAMIQMTLITFTIVASGFVLGYLGSLVVRGRSRDIAIAMVYNVGLRNIAAGLVLAIAQFPPPVAVPITLFMLFQQPLATIVPFVFARLDKKAAP
ncbi:MAG TPA: bile acid:sodium symporter family protein [Negativicutes bacterium]|nr:bile acid:sodium symporter family protein [Negativicutes bacterium]